MWCRYGASGADVIQPDDPTNKQRPVRGAGLSAVAGGTMFVLAFPALFYGLASKPIASKMVLLGLVLGAVGVALMAHAAALDRS